MPTTLPRFLVPISGPGTRGQRNVFQKAQNLGERNMALQSLAITDVAIQV